MNQILSQFEVEALLKAVGDDAIDDDFGGANDESNSSSPFAAANRMAIGADRRFDEAKPLLEDILEHSIRLFKSFLLGTLAKDLSVERISIEMVTYQDFTRRYDVYGRPYAFMPFDLHPLGKTGVVILEPSLAIGLMEGFMGGTLEADPTPIWRPLTTLELRVAERMSKEMLEALGQSLMQKAEFSVQALKIMTNAHLVKGMKEMTTVVVSGSRVLVRGKPLGEYYILLPQELVDSFAKPETALLPMSIEESEKWDDSLQESVESLDMNITGEIGSLTLSVRNLLNLKPGDVLSIEKGHVGEAIVKVEGVHKYTGMPGVYRGRKAIRIV